MLSYSLTPKSITVTIGFVPKTIPSTHPNFSEIVRLARDPQMTENQIAPLLDVGKTIENVSGGAITVKAGKLYMRGYEVKSTLANMILQLLREGNEAGAQPLKLFMEKAFANPDPRAATDLFDWVVHSKLPITPDGDILAWKAVRSDYYSIHGNSSSGAARDTRFNHSVGNTVEMDRTECNANPDQTCSTGLHFCAADYLSSYASGGSRIVAVAISPTDVVAFPRDYGWSKGRAAKYRIVGEVPQDQVAQFYPQGQRVYKWSPATPGQSKLGDVWQTRDGKSEVTITRTDGAGDYPVQGGGFAYPAVFTAKGKFVSDTEEHPLDLVKFLR